MIIDDDPASGFLSQILTEEMEIAEEVVHLLTADAGISFIKDHCLNQHAPKQDCPDLILLDINMPVKTGYEFLEDLKRVGQEAIINARVIALSSSSAPIDRVKMQQYGVRGYLEKPINELELLRIIQSIK